MQKGSRFKVGVQGSRRRREVIAFMSTKRSQASASVRECRRVWRIVGSRKSSRNAELSSLFTLSVPKVSTFTGIGGVVVAKRRTVVTFGLVSSLRVSKVSTFTGIGGSWSRNAELSSLLDSSRLFASQKCQHSQGSGGHGRETQNCRHFWPGFGERKGERERGEGRDEGREEGREERRQERGERRGEIGERREERRGERREDRREESGDQREERRGEERRGERRERRGERIEEGRERGEEREERRGEKRGERRERSERRKERGRERERKERGERGERDDPGPTSPKWFRLWCVIIIACT